MSDELTRLKEKVDSHEREIAAIQSSTREMIEGQKSLTKSIQDLTLDLRQYIVKHDHVATQNQELSKDVRALREKSAENQPVIDSIRQIAMKMFWLFISSLLTPAAMAALYFASSGGGK